MRAWLHTGLGFFAKYLPENQVYLVERYVVEETEQSRYYANTHSIVLLQFFFGHKDWHVLSEAEVKAYKLESL